MQKLDRKLKGDYILKHPQKRIRKPLAKPSLCEFQDVSRNDNTLSVSSFQMSFQLKNYNNINFLRFKDALHVCTLSKRLVQNKLSESILNAVSQLVRPACGRLVLSKLGRQGILKYRRYDSTRFKIQTLLFPFNVFPTSYEFIFIKVGGWIIKESKESNLHVLETEIGSF